MKIKENMIKEKVMTIKRDYYKKIKWKFCN